MAAKATRKSRPVIQSNRDRREASSPGNGLSKRNSGSSGATVAPPLEMLCFLLPLIAIYELACLLDSRRVIAYGILQDFLHLFGTFGVWAPGLMIVAILLATHVVSGRPWHVRWRRVGLMYVESAVAAAPLLLLSWSVPLWIGAEMSARFFAVAQGIGAGVYEELVFRLALISMIVIMGSDILRLHRPTIVILAVAASALLFAAHHHAPLGPEPFHAARFLFRTLAGVYLAAIFWFRGYALAAGCHAAYNSVLLLVVIGRP